VTFREVYDCAECGVEHTVFLFKGPKDKEPQKYVMCPCTFPKDPKRFRYVDRQGPPLIHAAHRKL